MWTTAIGRRLKRCCSRLQHGAGLTAATAAVVLSAAAVAQEPGAAGGGNVVASGRGWMFDAVIVAALFALALFVICRSSRRN